MTITEIKVIVQAFVSRNEIEEAIGILTKNFSGNKKLNDLILQSARFNDIKSQINKGIVVQEDANLVKNQVIMGVLSFVDDMEEDQRLRKAVFVNKPTESLGNDKIPVFLSVGAPHTEAQKKYVEFLKRKLADYDIQLDTLGDSFWSVKNPLSPIQKKMKEVYGCVVLAMERFYSKEGIYKRGGAQEKNAQDEYFSTAWTQIEAAMAYQMELPILILKEERLKGEGMLDGSIHEWLIIRVNPENPYELDDEPIRSFIKSWIQEVKQYKAKRESEY